MDLARKLNLLFKKKILQLLKFGMVGLLGMGIDFTATYFFKEQVQLNAYLANSIGFGLAVINNYLINRFWTFKSKETAIGKQFLQFFFIALIGLVLNTACIYLLQLAQLPFYLAKLMAIALVFIWNYSLNSTLTFHKN